ncbi:MAG TPA: hypothetical protein VG366_01340 [Solirubrobacteraceae bacterium]|jgi:hypothetical protein|nr:hypothetical protein [Solirubrobacteraceae bacterium]
MSGQLRVLALLEALVGGALLLDPTPILARVGDGTSVPGSAAAARVLGARQLLQAVLLVRSGATGSGLRLAAAVDAAHAVSMSGLAWWRPQDRILALASAGLAAGFCCWELSASGENEELKRQEGN